ncbi:18274_t:CDS:2 [Gigaspora margarita]|uniref:18274_t:CDS:1 n=1 Tax=Gigaspora margarita TaxID=4874 RepID=A0ABN7V3B0_GIGMA|nr:18274_t:CDS:2 [Gigaspora margarita]
MFISIIEELVKNYISNDQSIIVAMITCKDEIENQPIATYAKEANKGGIHTTRKKLSKRQLNAGIIFEEAQENLFR